jgi:hypothetical protein
VRSVVSIGDHVIGRDDDSTFTSELRETRVSNGGLVEMGRW